MCDRSLNRYGCRNCGHSFTLLPSEKKAVYNDDYYASHSKWFEHPNFRLFNFINSQIAAQVGKKDASILDVGCGNGDLLKFLRAKNPDMKLSGIDLHQNSYPGIRFINGDILKDNITETFDAVTSLAAIEHVDDLNVFIEKLKSQTTPKGLIVIMTDNTGGVFYVAARLLKRLGLDSPYKSLYEPAHLNHFTNRSLRILLENHGLKILSQTNHNYPVKAINLPPCGIVMRSIYMLGAGALFALPSRFGILQTVICKNQA